VTVRRGDVLVDRGEGRVGIVLEEVQGVLVESRPGGWRAPCRRCAAAWRGRLRRDSTDGPSRPAGRRPVPRRARTAGSSNPPGLRHWPGSTGARSRRVIAPRAFSSGSWHTLLGCGTSPDRCRRRVSLDCEVRRHADRSPPAAARLPRDAPSSGEGWASAVEFRAGARVARTQASSEGPTAAAGFWGRDRAVGGPTHS
jgi:hypothetical protein